MANVTMWKGAGNQMEVPDFDVQYYLGQGWTTTNPSSGNTTPPSGGTTGGGTTSGTTGGTTGGSTSNGMITAHYKRPIYNNKGVLMGYSERDEQMTQQDYDRISQGSSYWSIAEQTTTPPTNSNLTLAALLADSRVTQDQGVNGTTMKQWIQGNSSLIPGLASRGYTIDDLVNEAYSQVHHNTSAFSGDMATTTRANNTPVTNNTTPPTPPTTSTPPTGATLISNPADLVGLTEDQIWRDPNSNKIYRLVGSTTPPTPPTTSTPPAGATLISNPADLAGLTEDQIWRDPNSNKIYRLAGTTTLPTPPSTDDEKIIYKRKNPTTGNDDLYIKSGDVYYRITSQAQLEKLVFEQGYKDRRTELPTDAQIGGIAETPPDTSGETTGAFDPYEEALKYGYTREDFANDSGFYDYWSKKTPDQLKLALSKRGDWDATTNAKKGITEETLQNISADKVKEAFAAFGYTPSNADIYYWSNKPQTDYNDMLEKLNARKEKDDTTVVEPEPIKWGGKTLDKGLTNINSLDKTWLLKFADDPDGSGPQTSATIFLVNNDDKTIRPFLSETSFNSYMKSIGREDITLKVATENGLITLAPIELLSNDLALSSGKGYHILMNEKGIQIDGTYPDQEQPEDSTQLQYRYGNARNEEAEKVALRVLDNEQGGLLTILKSMGVSSGVSPALIDEVSKDHAVMGLYIDALAYGGYDIPDVIRDLVRRQQIKDGKTEYSSKTVISPSQTAANFYATTEGGAVKTDINLKIPDMFGTLDMDTLTGLSIFQLPQEAFDVLVPPFDPKSEAGKAAMAAIEASHYDILLQQLNATTEQEKALADLNWKTFQDDLAKKYNIALSDDAVAAWGQLQNIKSGYGAEGAQRSGSAEEASDKMLQATRKADERLREEKISEEKKQEATYLMKSGTAEQIKSFLDDLTDPAEKSAFEKYFTPSDDIKSYFSISNLKSLFPTLTDEQIKRYSESLIDPESGLYRSQVYQKLYENKYGPIQVPDAGVIPGKEAYQLGEVSYDADGNLHGYGALFEAEKKKLAAEREFVTGRTYDTVAPGTTGTPEIPTSTGWYDPATGESTPPGVGTPDTPGTSTPPAGATLISNPADLAGLTEDQIWRDPNSNKIYRLAGTTTPPTTSTPPAGATLINSLSELNTLTESQIWRDPNSNKIYRLASTTTPPTPPTASTPPVGATLISNPTELSGLTESQIWRDPNSDKIYRLASTTTPPTPPTTEFQVPVGYEKISGALYPTSATQQGAYDDIQTDPTGTFLYGKKKTVSTTPPTPPTPPTTSTPPTGATLISNPADLAGLTEDQIWRDPNSNKIYRLVGSTTTPTPPMSWAAPNGYELISGPSQLPNYSSIINEPNSINKWGIKNATTPTVPTTPQETYPNLTTTTTETWVDPATGQTTAVGVGMLKSDYEKQKALGKL
jgi:hypothetical protein